MAESIFKRLIRYARYIFEYVFMEKPFGLDFSMRDTRLIDETHGKMHGYSKTDEAHIRQIFSILIQDYLRKVVSIKMEGQLQYFQLLKQKGEILQIIFLLILFLLQMDKSS